jgi:hypothetical protein
MMKKMDFQPRCMATALPTMPHRDPEAACRVMLKNFPEAPCIPRLSLSIRMYLDGMPGLIIDPEKKQLRYDLSRGEQLQQFYERVLSEDLEPFAMNPKYASAFYALLRSLEKSPPPGLKLVHSQLPGLLTWGLSLIGPDGRPAWYDPVMREVLTDTLVMKVKWQQKKIREVLPEVPMMITLGEPSLGMMSSPFGGVLEGEVIEVLGDFFAKIEALGSVHCCSNMDWSQLMRSATQVINFDAYQFADKIALYPGEVRAFLERGGMLAWGIVPVSEEVFLSENKEHLRAKLEEGMDLLAKGGIERRRIVEQSFITPCCTTATLTPETAEQVFEYTQSLSREMRRDHLPGC